MISTEKSKAAKDARIATIGSTGMRSEEIDAVKGILMFFVIVGHNINISALAHPFYSQLYNFHVTSFLVLPFIFKTKPLSAAFAVDRAIRYLVPYAVFYLIAAMVFRLALTSEVTFIEGVKDILVGLLIGSSDMVKVGSGLSLFWFLPTLLTLALLRSAGVHSRILMLTIACICTFLHFTVAYFPEGIKAYTPFGLLIAGFIYPLGLLVSRIWPWWKKKRERMMFRAFLWLLWGVIIAISVVYNTKIDIGALRLYGFADIGWLLIHDLHIVIAFLAFASISDWLARVPGLVMIGKYSLIIYLSHSLVFYGMHYALNWYGWSTPTWGIAITTITGTTAISCAVAYVVYNTAWLRRIIVPKTLKEWSFFTK